jgi:hypothetical protein
MHTPTVFFRPHVGWTQGAGWHMPIAGGLEHSIVSARGSNLQVHDRWVVKIHNHHGLFWAENFAASPKRRHYPEGDA